MSESDSDPIASTQMFRAFVQGAETEPAGRSRSRLVLFAVILAVVVAALAVGAWLALA